MAQITKSSTIVMHQTILRIITLWACFVVGSSLGQSLESNGQHEDVYLEQAIRLMNDTPLIDTHVDLPQIIRSLCKLYTEITVPTQTKIVVDTPTQIEIRSMESPPSQMHSLARSTYHECGKAIWEQRSSPCGHRATISGQAAQVPDLINRRMHCATHLRCST